MDWISELLERMACGLAVKTLARLAQALPRVLAQALPGLKKAAIDIISVVSRWFVSGYFRHCYYPGSTLMSMWCWLRHPVSAERRADSEFTAGWNWPDPDEALAGIG